MTTIGIDEEWEQFMLNETDPNSDEELLISTSTSTYNQEQTIPNQSPEPSNIYISTKTKISYLNTTVDLNKIFWLLPIVDYNLPICGIIKKQMKFNSTSRAQLENIQNQLKNVNGYFYEHVITHIDNPSSNSLQFKDVRKVSIGLSKKDITHKGCKKKSAFYNCFVMIVRLNLDGCFREFHVKVFNTGKLEIPGIQSDDHFVAILNETVAILQPYYDGFKVEYDKKNSETVLINSNFNCGYYVDREKLYELLKYKYNIQAQYDPCSYPGIQCKYYYDPNMFIDGFIPTMELAGNCSADTKKEVSFMIFRTGSVLIVGKCDENILYVIYEYLKNIFIHEYKQIYQPPPLDVNANTLLQKHTAQTSTNSTKRKRTFIIIDNLDQ